MGKKVKEKQIYVRVDDAELAKINAYVEAADLTVSDLVRLGIGEYMVNHPIKDKDTSPTKIKTPGEV